MPRFQPSEAPAAHASFATVESFLATDTDVTYGYTATINEEALKEAYENVRLHHAPPIVGGTDLLLQMQTKGRILPFGCASIDAMLEGGFREGQVFEIYGDSGSGKTQLCLTACAHAAARNERVLYIDTSNAFTTSRVITMLRAIPSTKNRMEEAVGCISVIQAYTAHDVLTALDSLLQQHKDPASSTTSPNLIILDSIGAVIAPVLGAGGSGTHLQGHVLLAAMGNLLKQVAQQLNTAILVTNHMVGGGSGGGISSRDRERGGVAPGSTSYMHESESKRPALGESWNHQCHCRIHLSSPPSEGQHWTAVVRASTMLSPGKTSAHYWLTSTGVSATPPTAPPSLPPPR